MPQNTTYILFSIYLPHLLWLPNLFPNSVTLHGSTIFLIFIVFFQFYLISVSHIPLQKTILRILTNNRYYIVPVYIHSFSLLCSVLEPLFPFFSFFLLAFLRKQDNIERHFKYFPCCDGFVEPYQQYFKCKNKCEIEKPNF